MTLPILAIVFGLALLIWSADRFIDGASATARHLGMPPMLIGMIVIGFGTSAPEMTVSALAALQGNPGLALGNAYGSNIANIGLILGLTALITPIAVQSSVLRKELPILLGITLLAGALIIDGELTRLDALILLLVFAVVVGFGIVLGLRNRQDALANDVVEDLNAHPMPLNRALIWLVIGIILLIVSSRILVWGAVDLARGLGVSDVIIGLTIVAIGTSLPELASSLVAARKGEHDLALGNIIGSNMFNTLAVVGIAAALQPMHVDAEIMSRDWVVMAAFTLALFVFSYGFRSAGRINRLEGGILLAAFAGYLGYLAYGVIGG